MLNSMASLRQWVIVAILFIAGYGLLISPLVRYFFKGWAAKRKDIMDALDANARAAYFNKFCPNQVIAAGKANEEFERLYDDWYGRKHFLFSGLVFGLCGAVAVIAIVLTGLHRLKFMENPFVDLPITAMAALAGGYLWVVNDQVARARRLDFSPSDVQWGTVRLAIAVPMGYAFAAVAPNSAAPFVAFALGSFPLQALLSALRAVAEKRLNLGPTQEDVADDIIRLQGVNKTIVERLANEDVTTVVQLAYCDPVRIVMRSNLTFNFVTDCMNQALAWMYFQDNFGVLRSVGLRGGVEIRSFVVDLDNTGTTAEEQANHNRAVTALPKIAAALKLDSDVLQISLRQVAGDPFSKFLSTVWQ